MKQFDDIFREKVDKAFSNYNADHLADEGWDSFLAKKKKEKGNDAFLIFPFWGRAASIALVIGLGALIVFLSVKNRNNREHFLTTSENGPVKEAASQEKPGITVPAPGIIAVTARLSFKNDTLRHPGKFQEEDVPGKPDSVEINREMVTPVNPSTIMLPVFAEDMIELANDTIEPEDRNKSGESTIEGPVQAISGTTEEHSRGLAFLTGMSGMMAHVNDAANNTPGLSVGVYLEKKISGRFSFRPGLAFGMSSLGIDYPKGNFSFAAAFPVINSISGTPESFNGQLSMVTMEIPLNIVFKLVERKSSSVYLAAGASSIFYISEHFTGDFVNEFTQDKYNESTGTTYTETKYSTVSLDNTYGAFSRTDYFGLATLSAGYSLPLGSASIMHIEPFMQFPLNDLTSLDLRIYYTGISMKISIGRKNN